LGSAASEDLSLCSRWALVGTHQERGFVSGNSRNQHPVLRLEPHQTCRYADPVGDDDLRSALVAPLRMIEGG
jgi:hypothetical protein